MRFPGKMEPMSDTKFLGLCVLLGACMISATIIWSTKANVDAMVATSTGNSETALVSAPASSGSVTISGPVTLAPITTPIPVTIATPNDTPITVKDASEKKWTR